MLEISTNTQIGLGLTVMGIAFLFLGIVFLFDKGLLAIGNVSIPKLFKRSELTEPNELTMIFCNQIENSP